MANRQAWAVAGSPKYGHWLPIPAIQRDENAHVNAEMPLSDYLFTTHFENCDNLAQFRGYGQGGGTDVQGNTTNGGDFWCVWGSVDPH